MPFELLNQAWVKSDAHIKAANVLALTRRFNALACWVSKSIIEMKTPRARAKRLAKLIDIAGFLLLLNNYSSLMAIVAGLNKACVIRLKQTFRELPSKSQKKLHDLERMMTAESSYKNYRAALRSVNGPCIPYFDLSIHRRAAQHANPLPFPSKFKGVYLIDLTYMEDGNPDKIETRINFTKREMISGVIREIQQYQGAPLHPIAGAHKPDEELLQLLFRLPEANDEVEKALWLESKKKE
ncbi:hypothetical protein HK102_004817 [Quaeritorhiza haematococci]|nr:hypothetical protein HK102_004817 [Quaeritorhiza haematococci]